MRLFLTSTSHCFLSICRFALSFSTSDARTDASIQATMLSRPQQAQMVQSMLLLKGTTGCASCLKHLRKLVHCFLNPIMERCCFLDVDLLVRENTCLGKGEVEVISIHVIHSIKGGTLTISNTSSKSLTALRPLIQGPLSPITC